MQEFDILSKTADVSQAVIKALEDAIVAICAVAQGAHGEVSVAKAVSAGYPCFVTKLTEDIDENIVAKFLERLNKEGIKYMDVENPEDKTRLIVYRKDDMDRVKEISHELNENKEKDKDKNKDMSR